MFNVNRSPWFCRFGGFFSGTGLQRCFFIHTEDHLMGEQLPCVEVADFLHLSAKSFITRCLGAKPHVVSPGFQMVSVQDAPYGFRGYAFDDAVFFQVVSELMAVPKRNRSSKSVRHLTCDLYKMQSNFRGKKRAFAHARFCP